VSLRDAKVSSVSVEGGKEWAVGIRLQLGKVLKRCASAFARARKLVCAKRVHTAEKAGGRGEGESVFFARGTTGRRWIRRASRAFGEKSRDGKCSMPRQRNRKREKRFPRKGEGSGGAPMQDQAEGLLPEEKRGQCFTSLAGHEKKKRTSAKKKEKTKKGRAAG